MCKPNIRQVGESDKRLTVHHVITHYLRLKEST